MRKNELRNRVHRGLCGLDRGEPILKEKDHGSLYLRIHCWRIAAGSLRNACHPVRLNKMFYQNVPRGTQPKEKKMFITDTEVETINREISKLQTTLEEAGVAHNTNLVKPTASTATAFMQQREKYDQIIAAGLLVKMLPDVPGLPEIPGEKDAFEKIRVNAIHNVICALMVLRALS